ncbi:MAG: glycosyltransferase [Bacteroidetes bacterium]|nr:glycosyltransferase [Bacteroidota bacterium]
MVARFEYWKGHVYAISAFKKLVKEYPKLRLYIFGSKGESFDYIMNLIKDNDLKTTLSTKDLYPTILPYSTCSIYIFTYRLRQNRRHLASTSWKG